MRAPLFRKRFYLAAPIVGTDPNGTRFAAAIQIREMSIAR